MIASHLAPRDPNIDGDGKRGCMSSLISDDPPSNIGDEGVGAKEAAAMPISKNEFTDAERNELWVRLYGTPPIGERPETTQRIRSILRRYMLNMALSNTVKPYEENGIMKFQAESAEELAMATFSRSCGFFKKQINPTILEITEYDESLREKPTKIIETYNHVATFGFTPARARVTVIYQRIDGDKKCHVMMKGQDTVALPLLTLDVDEDQLLENLKNMSTNGLRTLVCGYCELDSQWWSSKAAVYNELIQRDATSASEGHPDKCSRAPNACEKCAQHDFFDATEKSAGLRYLGCIGLEDQLQLLVPECIVDCVRGGIKFWMITGDKLLTVSRDRSAEEMRRSASREADSARASEGYMCASR
jgi:magnesium-transporting ATPase (P-type)